MVDLEGQEGASDVRARGSFGKNDAHLELD